MGDVTIPIPQDDQVPPEEVIRRLYALAENLPTMLHEQVAATKADTEAALDLTRELEKTVSTHGAEQAKSLAGVFGLIRSLELRLARTSMVNQLQNSLLVLLATKVLHPERDFADYHGIQLAGAIGELQGWSEEKYADEAVWENFINRLYPEIEDKPPPAS